MTGDPRRALPSVQSVLELSGVRQLLEQAPRDLLVGAVRDAIEMARRQPARTPRAPDEWRAAVSAALALRERPSLRPVLNATGVVLHTNLGRAPLSQAALDAIASVAAGYSNLEYDLEQGARGSRYAHCVALLRELTGAEDALVVNNGAAALVVTLNTLATGRDAIVSRGELVEIGGSFRVPDIMAKSGARLVEVGTTNRTHLSDYTAVLGPDSGAVVKVHRSNFAMAGFVSDVAVPELAAACRVHGVPVVHDLGSGLFLSLEPWGLRGEPVAREAIREGAAAITMSGDKLLGGPQAGIILGDAPLMTRIRSNPLTRALRVDKLTLAALTATLALYRDPERAVREVPALALLCEPVEALAARAGRMREALAAASCPALVVPGEGSVGGGAFPAVTLPSVALALEGDARALERALRAGSPPVIARIANDRLLLDLRAVPERDDERLVSAVIAACRTGTAAG